MLNDLINWRIVSDKDEGAGNGGSSEDQDNKGESGDSQIDYSKLDYSKIDVTKLPVDILAKHPEYQKVKKSDEKHRKTNSDLRKQLESVDKEDSDKENKADNNGSENTNDPNAERFTRLESMLGQVLRERNLTEALKRLNVDDKGNEKTMLTEKHFEYIQGNTLDEMIASGKKVIETFELDKKNLNSGEGGKGNTAVTPFGKIDIKSRIERRLNPTSNNPFDITLHQQKGGF